MNHIKVSPIQQASGEVLFPEAIYSIDNDNWNYPADVKVQFGIAYDANNLYLKYEVDELHPKAVCTTTNGPVWEDSCVEFFIAFNEREYYNLEFNCIGTRLVGLGTDNQNRQWLNPQTVEGIQTIPSLMREPLDIENTPTQWELNIRIPKTVFGSAIRHFEKGMTFKANFFKCGDNQKQMHFLSWNPIPTATPNFHLPAFFGSIELV